MVTLSTITSTSLTSNLPGELFHYPCETVDTTPTPRWMHLMGGATHHAPCEKPDCFALEQEGDGQR